MKHIPQRTCICCRNKFAKSEMVRFVKCGDKVFLDESRKSDGRGAYFCGSSDCAKKLVKSRGLDRAFKQRNDDAVYEEIKNRFLSDNLVR